jgi:flagellar basal body-associated protein FliL
MSEETPTEGTEGEENAPAKAKKKLPLALIGLGVQLVFMLAAGAMIIKGTLLAPKPDFSHKALVERAVASVRDNPEEIQTMDLDYFVVNVTGSHQLKAKLQVEVSNPEILAALTKRMPAVKQRVLNILARSRGDVHTLQSKLRIKEMIRDSLNQELTELSQQKGIVRDVYFMELIII